MKKKAIVLLAFAVALAAVSCQKEAMKEAETTPTGEGMTISAVTEGIGADVKADLAYKYDVIWRTGDKICVKNSEKKSVEFTLTGGVGTTKGTFSSNESISGEVEGFYPASVADLIWPAEQQNNHVPPMYCKKNLTSTQNQTFNFASLGSVLQLNFNSTTSGIVLKSIEVKADEAMSGAFTVENGQAKVSQPEGDKPGIILDLGEGVTLGTSAKKFNIAVPAGEYHGLSIVLTATNGKKCTINAKKDKAIEIVYNTVNTLAISGEFKAGVPAGALPGVFSVGPNATDKVHFSKGNLWADASGTTPVFYFESNQYDVPDSWSTYHVSHFFWSKDASVAYAESYNESGDANDVFFTNDPNDEKKANSDFKVKVGDIEQSGWRTLTTAEWQYLFDTRTVNGGTGEGKSYQRAIINSDATGVFGMILYPDNYTSQTDATSYISEEWTTMEENGCVFLPAAGYRLGSSVSSVGDEGNYWSSTAYDEGMAYFAGFDSYNFYYSNNRNYGYSVRLITDASATPAPTPTTTGTAKRTGDIDVNWVQLWAGGPKFAEYNVGANSATDEGIEMSFADATNAGSDYVWGANWCTPSKDQMNELLKAATADGSTKVDCEYTDEGGTWGFKFTGKETGYTNNSVFFPSKGGDSDYGAAEYWSGSAEGCAAWRMCLRYYGFWGSDWDSLEQDNEYLVRPVLAEDSDSDGPVPPGQDPYEDEDEDEEE